MFHQLSEANEHADSIWCKWAMFLTTITTLN